ncbi:TonB-dependent receptor [Sphingomonas sp. G-3-2-10]|uniref:TonB-dependent receptor n=1 Tax=Sphingomonas sp. G-3-2-10 TaxID=2728838 RepID=UPI00146C8DAA|nr:TonB-dependent receptor [Sphingomonas sp. G-3-2-10]NML04483.1 TonB-dependent receptor [Sphingomonas sp. G-3-2-10]
MKKFELLAASALTIFLATPAMAQDAPPAEDSTSQDYQSANDIVVRATQRNETVQTVPIAVTAVGAELLQNAGVQDIKGLEQLAPSLQTTTGQSAATGSSLSIRGVGTAGDNPGFEPAVGVFIDGVFRARAGVALAELPELQRVEVLRGPQGTLFGRNTSAGALSVFTAQPEFELGGYIEGSYGNYNAYELEGAITGPVSEQFALRLDAGYRKRDGYINDANSSRKINNIDRWNVRGQALLDTGDITLRIIGDYSETDEACCGAVSIARGSLGNVVNSIAASQGRTGLFIGDATTISGTSYTFNPEHRTMAVSPNRSFGERVKDYGASAELNWDLGNVTLTSITAYRQWRATRNQDIDFSGLDRAYRDGYQNNLNDFTQEFRVQGSMGALDWLIGGFYLNEDLELRDTVRFGNDANRYVDTVFAGALGAAPPAGFGTPLQFYGSLGAGVPLFGSALLNPAVPNSLPALSAAYGASLAPLVGCFRANAGTAPSSLCVIPGVPTAAVPGMLALVTSPLPGVTAGQGNNSDNFGVKTQAFALFTHNIINVSDKFSITLGARWNYEKKELNASINNDTGSCAFFNQVRAGNPAAATYAFYLRQAGLFNNLFLLSCNPAVNTEFNGTYNHDKSESQITGTAKLAYKFSPTILGYASYDRGYKSGGYNLDQATFDSVLLGGNGAQASDLAFGRETVDSFEIGFKTSWGREFTFNIAGFYAKYNDLQNLVFSGNNFVVQNIDSSTSKGVEAEATIRPSQAFTVRFGYTYLDAKYDASNNFTGTPLAGLEGRQVQNQPKHVVTSTVTWKPRLSDNINGLVHVDMRYNSEVEISGRSPLNADRGIVRNPGYALVSARLGLQSADGNISGEFYVENLFNQYYNITGFAVPEQTGNYAGYPGYPRFYGVRARFGF